VNGSHRARRRAALLAFLALGVSGADARADWLITPFIGGTFGGHAIIDLEQGAGSSQLIFGGAGAWLSDGIFGVEAEFAYAPRYFDRDNRGGLITSSHLVTLNGNVIVTLPLTITRESLRPYVTGGMGWMDPHIEEFADVFPEFVALQEPASASFSAGGGVIGFLTESTGARFDIRHVRSLARGDDPFTGVRRSKLSFWRITAGVTLRY
jgi:hypothetical protein